MIRFKNIRNVRQLEDGWLVTLDMSYDGKTWDPVDYVARPNDVHGIAPQVVGAIQRNEFEGEVQLDEPS